MCDYSNQNGGSDEQNSQFYPSKHQVHPTQVTTWKRQAIDELTGLFSDKARRAEDNKAVKISMDGFQAKRVIKDWIEFYNSERPHTALDKRTPDGAFFDTETTKKAAWT